MTQYSAAVRDQMSKFLVSVGHKPAKGDHIKMLDMLPASSISGDDINLPHDAICDIFRNAFGTTQRLDQQIANDWIAPYVASIAEQISIKLKASYAPLNEAMLARFTGDYLVLPEGNKINAALDEYPPSKYRTIGQYLRALDDEHYSDRYRHSLDLPPSFQLDSNISCDVFEDGLTLFRQEGWIMIEIAAGGQIPDNRPSLELMVDSISDDVGNALSDNDVHISLLHQILDMPLVDALKKINPSRVDEIDKLTAKTGVGQ